ncbi:MAG: sigma-70 family RNA polymerase sigma factor [Ilumatobacter sp.]|uniref:RNA polymerase sigma factor n=1 Tax=Ilumatobacter sp. TaxID=1967498 RepID=UPI002605CF8E|nr:sigma-70 family RNA polymerase sigma factor [Ilumatobacter sp.]MDJ0768103.1 sigma-70 family RNA polymerase sigma factor [Ilumatobacter sp.]
MERLRNAKDVAVRQGPAATLEALYRAEYTGMVRLAFTLIGNNAEAEEVVQESFVDISFRLDDPDTPVRQPGAYLRTIVVGRCRSLIRRRRLMRERPPAPPDDLTPSAESLWDVLHTLPEHQRIAVVLKYYGGYRASEIARITEQPSATVRSHLRRALAAMRKELTP